MFRSALAALLLTATVSGATQALAQSARGGTQAEQQACARDVQKFCRKIMDQGDFVILACLKENRPKISRACNQVLLNNGQ